MTRTATLAYFPQQSQSTTCFFWTAQRRMIIASLHVNANLKTNSWKNKGTLILGKVCTPYHVIFGPSPRFGTLRVSAKDLTKKKRTDHLTGLSNRIGFDFIFDWQGTKTFRFDSILIWYPFNSKTIWFDTKIVSADMKKICGLEVDRFYKRIVHQDGKNIWESLLWWCLVNFSFSTITIQGFSCSPFFPDRIKSNRIKNRKFHSILSAFDSIWYEQKLSIR